MSFFARVSVRDPFGPLSPRSLGLVGQTSASWGVAGGLLATLVVAGHVMVGSLSSSVAFFTATLLFLVGSVAAFVHGALLAYLGRPDDVSRSRAIGRLLLGAVYEVPTLALGWFVAMLIILAALSLRSGQYLAFLAAALVGGPAATAFFAWAVVETSRSLQHLLRRWPDARAAFVTLILAALALVPIFVIARPEVWILGVRPTATTATVMALGATLWIAGPLVVLGFAALRRWRRTHPPASAASSVEGSLFRS